MPTVMCGCQLQVHTVAVPGRGVMQLGRVGSQLQKGGWRRAKRGWGEGFRQRSECWMNGSPRLDTRAGPRGCRAVTWPQHRVRFSKGEKLENCTYFSSSRCWDPV